MKTIFSSIAIFVAFTGFAQVTSETRPLSNFTGVRTSSVITIELTQGEADVVIVEGSAEDVKNVTTSVEDGILVVAGGSPKGEDGIKVKVTLKNLRMLDLSGASETNSTNKLIIDSLKMVGSGASNIKLDVQATKITTQLSGASNLKISGTTSMLNAQVSGAANLKAYQLIADQVVVISAGAANVHVNSVKSIDVTASGASDVHYQGAPIDKKINASGASSVVMRDGDAGAANDTTSIHMGKYDVHVTEREGEDDERSEREKKADDSDFEFWEGLDFGVNGFLTANNKVELPAGFNFLELNYAKSYFFSWNMFQKNIHLYRNNINLGTGLGFSWYHYNFRNSYTLSPNVAFASATMDSIKYSRNRLGMTYVNVPLFLEFNTNNKDAGKSLHIAGGMEFGYNVFNNVLKQRYEIDGHKFKTKQKDDFNVNPFRYDLIARVGYGDFTIFGKYSLSTLFEKGKGPTVYPFSAGINISF